MDAGAFVGILALILIPFLTFWTELLGLEEKNRTLIAKQKLWAKREAPCAIQDMIKNHTSAARLLRLYFEELARGTNLAIGYAGWCLVFVVVPTFAVHLFADLLKAHIVAEGLSYLGLAQAFMLLALIILTTLVFRSLRYRKQVMEDLVPKTS